MTANARTEQRRLCPWSQQIELCNAIIETTFVCDSQDQASDFTFIANDCMVSVKLKRNSRAFVAPRCPEGSPGGPGEVPEGPTSPRVSPGGSREVPEAQGMPQGSFSITGGQFRGPSSILFPASQHPKTSKVIKCYLKNQTGSEPIFWDPE